MDIIVIVSAILGVGYITVGIGAAVKDAASGLYGQRKAQLKPIDRTKIKRFFKTFGVHRIVYACLNVVR